MTNSSARAIVDVGSVIADTYIIEALLGRGGMGAVFLAHHKRLAGKRVAIKILHTEIEDADIVARFKREAEIAARLNHPNIVGVIDYNVAPDGMPYLVLDYLEGETLAQRIARGPMPVEQVMSIVRQVGSALAAAHRAGIVHRDLKPQNIFLVPTEVDGRHVEIAKVLDFGISKIRGSQTVKTQDSALLGTPQYMAPEQATGQHANVDERTDVFALGAIVYEMLSGQPAFSGASIPEVVFKVVYEQPPPLAQRVPSLPPAITTAVAQAMAKPSEERFASVARFVEAMTGQPLTLTRGQAPAPPGAVASPDSPSAARRVASGEAFANTMGSGDFGDSPIDPLLATAAPAAISSRNAAHAANAANAPSAPGTSIAPPVDLSSAATRAPVRRIRAAAWVGAIIAAAAVAAGAFYVVRDDTDGTAAGGAGDDRRVAATDGTPPVTSDPRPSTPPPGPPTTEPRAPDSNPTAGGPTPPAPPMPPAPPPPDDGTARTPNVADNGSGTSGKPSTPDPNRRKPNLPSPPVRPPPPPDDDLEGDEDVREKLRQAASALDRREYEVAERLANAVINGPGSPKQHATARMIRGIVQCAHRNDQEAASIDLRSLVRFRNLRARLLNVCRNHGVFIGGGRAD